MRFGVCMGAGLALIACSSPEEMGEAVGLGESDIRLTVSSTDDPRAVNFEDSAEREGGARDFAYAWPAEISAIPGLVALLEQRRDEALTRQKDGWEQSLVDFADENCVGCKARSFTKSWNLAGNTPRFLSLEGETYVYSGGAHGNSFFDALVWDREAGEALEPMDMFASSEAMSDALRPAYCDRLVAAQAERRGETRASREELIAGCPGFDELVIVPVSRGGDAFGEIRVLAAPYVAGAYAEGPYVVDVPISQAFVAAVKEEYRSAFAAP